MISSTVITLLIGVAIGIALKWLHDWNKKRLMLNTLSACVEPPAYTTIGQMVDSEKRQVHVPPRPLPPRHQPDGMKWLKDEAAAEFGPKPTTYTRKKGGIV